MSLSKCIDLTGQIFGRLTVIKRAQDKVDASGKKRCMWLCQCECGNQVVVLGEAMKRGACRSCGCYRHDALHEIQSTHGETNTRLYGIWLSMRNRCNLSTSDAYADYGGRGIRVCDEWNSSFESFRDWSLENGYREDLTIDRIQNCGNYEPGNCRWVDRVAQANNRRSNRLLSLRGETHNVTEWAKILGKNPKTIFSRIYAGWSPEKALTT